MPESSQKPTLSLLVLLETDEDVLPNAWVRTQNALKQQATDWLIVDRRPAGELRTPIPEGWKVVSTPGYQLGLDIQSALNHCSGDAVAFVARGSCLRAEGVASALKVLKHQDSVDLVVGNSQIQGSSSQHLMNISASGLPSSPPPCWLSASIFKRTALASLSGLAYFPALLWLYKKLCRQEKAFHLSVDMQQFDRKRFFDLLPQHKHTNEWLEKWSTKPLDSAPQVSVILIVSGPASDASPALRSLCRQTLPPEQIQIVLVAEGSEGNIDSLDPAHFPVRVDRIRRRAHGLAKALNKALTQVVAPIVCFCRAEDAPNRDWLAHHYVAHKARKEAHLAVRGPALYSVEDSPLNLFLNEIRQTRVQHPLRGMSLENASFPTRSLQAIGGLSPAQGRVEAALDLAQRWLQYGYDFLYLPQAIVRRTERVQLQNFQTQERLFGRAMIATSVRHVDAVDGLNLQHLSLQDMKLQLEHYRTHESTWTQIAAGLAAISLDTIQVNRSLMQGHRELFMQLRNGWELLGRIDGLRAHSLSDFGDLLRGHPLGVQGHDLAPWLVAPLSANNQEWRNVVRHLLKDPERRPIVIWSTPTSLVSQKELIGFAAQARGEAALKSDESPPLLSILEETPPIGRLIRLLSGAKAVFHWHSQQDTEFFQLLELAQAYEAPNHLYPKVAPEPWQLATTATTRILAWPDWSSQSAMNHLFERYAALMVSRPNSCLCLRLDPNVDPPESEAVVVLEQAFEHAMSINDDLEVLLITESLKPGDWPRLAQSVSAVISPDFRGVGFRLQTVEMMDVQIIRQPQELVTLLQREHAQTIPNAEVQLLLLSPPSPPTIEHS